MTSSDVIVIGGGIIGASLALELRKEGLEVRLIDRAEPGREASYAAAGMLSGLDLSTHHALRDLAAASARLYPEFVREMEAESGIHVDLRTHGTVQVFEEGEAFPDSAESSFSTREVSEQELAQLEPALDAYGRRALLLAESSVDPRALVAAALKTAEVRGVHMVSGAEVQEVLSESGQVVGVRTSRSRYEAPIVVNCAGSWAGQIHAAGAALVPSRPIKGQMLDVVPRKRNLLRHVIHGHNVYIVPRTDGRVLIGATVEDVGFDKRVLPDTISRLHLSAAKLVPELGEARIHEVWAGLRPGSPDDLPILGHVGLDGYFVATGHFRNGILLAPVTARIMADLICRGDTTFNLAHFSAVRFQHSRVQA